jgi:hypothetical protein
VKRCVIPIERHESCPQNLISSRILSFCRHQLPCVFLSWCVFALWPLSFEISPQPSALAEQEALILRNELRLTREALEESRGFQEHCAWRIWALNWTLRVLSLVDLGFLIYLVYTHFTRRRRVVVVPPETHLGITGDTKGVSDSDSPINSPRRIESKGSHSSGSSPKSKGRPTRPSDRKTKQ